MNKEMSDQPQPLSTIEILKRKNSQMLAEGLALKLASCSPWQAAVDEHAQFLRERRTIQLKASQIN